MHYVFVYLVWLHVTDTACSIIIFIINFILGQCVAYLTDFLLFCRIASYLNPSKRAVDYTDSQAPNSQFTYMYQQNDMIKHYAQSN